MTDSTLKLAALIVPLGLDTLGVALALGMAGVLESLIVRGNDGQRPLSEQDLWDAFSARKKKQKLRITDALDRLEAAGLIERRAGRSMASEVAKYLDRIPTL